MLHLLQSIFGGGESRGGYPESLVEMAIERAIDGTDTRLRVLPGFRKALRDPVIHAIDHVVALVDAIPAPLSAGTASYGSDPRLRAMFASPKDMLETFGRDPALGALLASDSVSGASEVSALLLAQRLEKSILGMELVGDQVQREVQQVAVSFAAHRLIDPKPTAVEMRRHLKRRAFDHLLALALGRIAEASAERADLIRERGLLKTKLAALEHGGWSFDAGQADAPEAGKLEAELDSVQQQLDALGTDQTILHAHRDIVAEVLRDAENQLWSQEIRLYLDSMNIQRPPQDQSAREIVLHELHNSRGQCLTLLPVAVTRSEIPPREDFLAAAQRYLY